MGTCIHCGKPAGLLRNKHHECAEKYDRGWAEMVRIATQAATGSGDCIPLDKLERHLSAIAAGSFVPPEGVRQALIAGWEQAVGHFLEDGSLEPREEARLSEFGSHFDLSQEELDKSGAYTRFVKGAVLRELMEGKIPERFNVRGAPPFNFMKGEALIWAFGDVAYYEEKTRRQYVGGSQGVSLRIAKGVYYRLGSFRGDPVETVERVHVDTGVLAVTSKHVYFRGEVKAFRVRLDKIVAFTPYSDGIAIHRDAVTARPQAFRTGDGWFTYNLLVNAANLP